MTAKPVHWLSPFFLTPAGAGAGLLALALWHAIAEKVG